MLIVELVAVPDSDSAYPKGPNRPTRGRRPARAGSVPLLLLCESDLVTYEQIGLTAVELGQALGCQLGINRLLDLGIQYLVEMSTYRGCAIYRVDPFVGVIF